MESKTNLKEEPKSFLGFLGPFAPKTKSTTSSSQDHEAHSDPTEVESDSESTRSMHGQDATSKPQHKRNVVREEDGMFEPVLDNPPQKRASFLAMFLNNSDSESEVDTTNLIMEELVETKMEETEEETSKHDGPKEDAKVEITAPPTKGPGFFAGLFNPKRQEETNGVDLETVEPTSFATEEENGKPEPKDDTPPTAPSSNKDGKGFFGLFMNKKFDPEITTTEALDVKADSKDANETKVHEKDTENDREESSSQTDADASQQTSPENSVGEKKDPDFDFFGNLFKRNQKPEMDEEGSDAPTNNGAGEKAYNQDTTSEGEVNIDDIKATALKELDSVYPVVPPAGENKMESATGVKSKDKPPVFFGLFGRGKEPVEEVSSSDTVDDSKQENTQYDSRENDASADVGVVEDTAAPEKRDSVLDELLFTTIQTDQGASNVMALEEGKEKQEEHDPSAHEKRNSVLDELLFTTINADLEASNVLAVEDNAAETKEKQEERQDEALLSAEGTDRKIEECTKMKTPTPLDDLYVDENANMTNAKEEMCCSFMFC